MGYLRWTRELQEDRLRVSTEFVRSFCMQPQPADYLDEMIAASMRCPTNSAVAMVASFQTLGNQALILSTVDVPLMYVAIDEKRDQAEIVRQHAPAARVEIVGAAGHALFVDQPVRFNNLLGEFVAKLGGSDA